MTESLIKSDSLEQFETDLQELAVAYNAACEAHDEGEKEVIFDAICTLGLQMIEDMKEDPDGKAKIEAVISRLDIHGPKESLYDEMEISGPGKAFTSLCSLREPMEGESFYPDKFRQGFQDLLFAVQGFRERAIMAGTSDDANRLSREAEFRLEKSAEEVALLPAQFRAQALEVVLEELTKFGRESSARPRVFRKPGVKNYMKYERDVRKKMHEIRFPSRYAKENNS